MHFNDNDIPVIRTNSSIIGTFALSMHSLTHDFMLYIAVPLYMYDVHLILGNC